MDGTPELVLVLVLAALAAAGSWALFRDEPAEPARALGIAAAIASGVGLVVLRFGGPTAGDLRGRVAAVLGGAALGVGCGLASARANTNLPGSLRGAARGSSLSLALGGGAAAIVVLCVGRGAASALEPMTRALAAWAFGAALVGLAIGATDLMPLAAIAIAVQTIGCASANAPAALGPMLAVLAALAVVIGAASVRIEPDEAPDGPWLRGFAVTTFVGTLGAVSVSHWWTRGAGVVLAALAASIGVVLTLLLGRYHDDPGHRPARSLADVRGMDDAARASTGAIVGLEGFLAVSAIAAMVALAAARSGELSGGAAGGSAVAIGTSLSAWAYLRALADGEEGRTVAHDTLLLVLVGAAFAHHSTPTSIAAAAAALGLLASAMLERTAVAQPDPERAATFRRRAGTFTSLATLALSGGAVVASLLPHA